MILDTLEIKHFAMTPTDQTVESTDVDLEI